MARCGFAAARRRVARRCIVRGRGRCVLLNLRGFAAGPGRRRVLGKAHPPPPTLLAELPLVRWAKFGRAQSCRPATQTMANVALQEEALPVSAVLTPFTRGLVSQEQPLGDKAG